jgi:hypothetical protein
MMDAVGRETPDAVFAIVPKGSFTSRLPGDDVRYSWTNVCRHFLHRAIARMQDRAAPDPGGMPVMAGSDQGSQRCASQKPRAARLR